MDLAELEERDILHFRTINSKDRLFYMFAILSMIPLFIAIYDLLFVIFQEDMRAITLFVIFTSLFIILILLAKFYYRFLAKDLIQEGEAIEAEKGKLIFEGKFTNNIAQEKIMIYFTIFAFIIVFIMLSYEFIFAEVKGFVEIFPFFYLTVWLGAIYNLFLLIRDRFVWVYDNGIGIGGGAFEEKVIFKDEINKIILNKQNQSLELEIHKKDRNITELVLKGVNLDELYNIITTQFSSYVVRA